MELHDNTPRKVTLISLHPLSLYGRSELFEHFYNTEGKIKFIDIGCGPGTCGLAFTEYIFNKSGFEAVFDYYGVDVSITMQNQAKEIMTNGRFSKSNNFKFFKSISGIEYSMLSNSSCIIINTCYVFASDDLPIEVIANYINDLSVRFPYVPKYLLFQNPVYDFLNKRYIVFKKLLNNFELIYTKTSRIYFNYYNNGYGVRRDRVVFFEILKF